MFVLLVLFQLFVVYVVLVLFVDPPFKLRVLLPLQLLHATTFPVPLGLLPPPPLFHVTFHYHYYDKIL